MSRTFHDETYTIIAHGVEARVNLSRFSEQFQEAQRWLDTQVMNSMLPFMPLQNGHLQNLTRAASSAVAGTGIVYAAHGVPYGRYQYYGKVMVDSQTGKGPMRIPTGPGEYVLRFRNGAKLMATDRPLRYSQPNAKPEWFEVAKNRDGPMWVREVKRIAGGGSR